MMVNIECDSVICRGQTLITTEQHLDFITSLNETIGYTSALYESANFQNKASQDFAKAVALSQFEGLEVDTLEQIDYLRMIEENTREFGGGL